MQKLLDELKLQQTENNAHKSSQFNALSHNTLHLATLPLLSVQRNV